MEARRKWHIPPVLGRRTVGPESAPRQKGKTHSVLSRRRLRICGQSSSLKEAGTLSRRNRTENAETGSYNRAMELLK